MSTDLALDGASIRARRRAALKALRPPKLPPLFASEAQLCAAFIAWAEHHGWKAYAETTGWDIVLVNGQGVQIGVQAKMTLNVEVLDQAMPDVYYSNDLKGGPDYRAILVPCGDKGTHLLEALGLGLFEPVDERRNNGGEQPAGLLSFHQQLPDFKPRREIEGRDDIAIHYSLSGRTGQHLRAWHDWNPVKRIELPEFVPDVVAGASGPVQLTKWKIGALKIAALLELRGHVTRSDFVWAGIHMSRWTQPPHYWLRKVNGSRGAWYAPEPLPFVGQHPQVYPQVLEKVREHLASSGAPLLAL